MLGTIRVAAAILRICNLSSNRTSSYPSDPSDSSSDRAYHDSILADQELVVGVSKTVFQGLS
jgi:hypothetical protein